MASIATPRRSSARLRNQYTQPRTPASTAKLSSLVERAETPDNGVPLNLNSIVASAPAKTTIVPLNAVINTTPSARIKPSSEEMHPSHHVDAYKKKALTPVVSRFGQPTGLSIPKASPAGNPFSSPTFEFNFHRPSTDLSTEAQKLMGEVREQAARIKSQLFAQRDEQSAKAATTGSSARKLANPKGKIGRFSDVHMAQFKKMTSIADHPSSFRAEPIKFPTPSKSLKRSLEEPAKLASGPSPSKSVCSVVASEETAGPAKRYKISEEPSTKVVDVSTPTKASLARSSSTKSQQTQQSNIPKLVSSSATKLVVTPTAPRIMRPNTDVKPRSAFASKLTGGVRSILRRPQLKFSDDPLKIAAGTHVSTPQKLAQTENKMKPEAVGQTPGTPSNRREKHVNFSSSPDEKIASPTVATPSPSKKLVKYPVLPDCQATISTPTRNSFFQGDGVRSSMAAPVDFTFRAENTISFSPPKTSMQGVTTPTIRPVRPSHAGGPTDGTGSALSFPTVPHGLSNKKRKRDSVEIDVPEENKENQAVLETEQTEIRGESPSKKTKFMPQPSKAPPKTPVKRLKAPIKSKGKSILTMSRLNALAKPKNRG